MSERLSHSISPGIAVGLIRDAVANGYGVSWSLCGGSMYPMSRPDDRATIEHVGIKDVRCGDVVLFGVQNRMVVHRVVGYGVRGQSRRLLTMGDATLRLDAPVGEEQLLGRVICIERGERTIDLTTNGWRVLSWCIARYLLVASWLRKKGATLGLRGRALHLFVRALTLPERALFKVLGF